MSKQPPMPTIPSVVSHWIHNQAIVNAGARSQDVFNPATGQVARKVELASLETVQAAVDSAKQAFASWADTPPIRRARIMNKIGKSVV